jgi:WD40 repeat protein
MRRPSHFTIASFLVVAWTLPPVGLGFGQDADDAMPADAPTRSLQFLTDVMPILRQNCLACHHGGLAEGGLNLETVANLHEGGYGGEAVDLESPAESLLLLRATGAEEPIMPPEDNQVGARRLTADQLALIEAWIAAGCPDEVSAADQMQWQSLPAAIQSVYAVAVAPNGLFALAGIGNRAESYHLPTGRKLGSLVDPELDFPIEGQSPGDDGAAAGRTTAGWTHRDLVNAIAFSPDGRWLATGGYQSVKLWYRPGVAFTGKTAGPSDDQLAAAAERSQRLAELRQRAGLPQLDPQSPLVELSPAGERGFTVNLTGEAHLWAIGQETPLASITGRELEQARVVDRQHAADRMQGRLDRRQADAKQLAEQLELEQGKLAESQQKVAEILEQVTAEQQQVTEAETGRETVAQQLAALAEPQPSVEEAVDPAADPASATLEPPAGDTSPSGDESADPPAEPAKTPEQLREELQKQLEEREKQLTEARQKLEKSRAEQAKREQAHASLSDLVQTLVGSVEQQRQNIEQLTARLAQQQAELADAQAALESTERRFLRASFTPEGDWLVVLTDDHRLRLYDASSGQLDRLLDPLPSPLVSWRWSQDSAGSPRLEISLADGRHGDLQVPGRWQLSQHWHARAGLPVVDRVTALAFSPDGRELAVGSGQPSRSGDICLVSLDSDQPQWQLLDNVHSDVVHVVKYSPDGERIASGGADRQIVITDRAATDRRFRLEGHTHHVLGLSWQNSGQRLVSGSADLTVKVWDVEQRQQERTVSGFSKEVTAVAFAGTGTEFVATSGEGKLRLINADDAKTLVDYQEVGPFPFAAATDVAGRRILVGGSDGRIRQWIGREPKPQLLNP